MKRTTLFKQSVFATLFLSATVTAFAAGGQANGPGRNPNPYAVSAAGSSSCSQETALACIQILGRWPQERAQTAPPT